MAEVFRPTGGGQYHHLVCEVRDQGLEDRVVDVDRGTLLGDHQPELIDEVGQFDADNPTMVGQTFTPNVAISATFPPGIDELTAVGVGDPQDRGSGQKAQWPGI